MTDASEPLLRQCAQEVMESLGAGLLLFEHGEERASCNGRSASLLLATPGELQERGRELFPELYGAARAFRSEWSAGRPPEGVSLSFCPRGVARSASRTVLAEYFRLGPFVAACLRDFTRPGLLAKQGTVMRGWCEYMFEATPNMMHSIDPSGRLLRVNGAWLENLGYAREEVLGRHLATFMAEDSARRCREETMPRFWQEGVARDQPFVLLAKDGSLRHVLINSLATADPEGRRMSLSILSDVSRERGIERALTAALEHERQTAAAHAAFMANLSQELRTPFGGIIGTFQMVAELTDDENIRDFARMGLTSASRLLEVFDDLLEFSRLESGAAPMTLAPFSPSQVIESVVALYRLSATEKGVDLSWQADGLADACLLGDERRIRQALMSLVGNALKFTAKGRVRVTASAESLPEPGGLMVRFTVEDTGAGIGKARLRGIFERFARPGGSPVMAGPGTGMGLPIVDRLARLMHGSVVVRSREGRGSAFTLSLPLSVVQVPLPEGAGGGEPGCEARAKGPRARTPAPSGQPKTPGNGRQRKARSPG